MRILQVSHAFPPTFGGVETHLWDITHELTRRGHEVACLVGGNREITRHEVPGRGQINVHRTPEISVDHLVSTRKGSGPHQIHNGLYQELASLISATLSQFEPDIIHMHNAHHFAPELARAIFEYGTSYPIFNGVHDRVGEHVYDEVLFYPWARVLYASRYLAETLPSDRPSSTLHLGVDLDLFRAEGPRDPRFLKFDPPVIFHPARLLRWKGVLVGLDAFIMLRKRLQRGTLVLCDSAQTVDDQGELSAFRAEVEAAATRSGVAEHVHFLRFAREEMPQAYRASDLVWYPTTDDEPFGLVPLEAMACGVPIIVSRSGGMTETVIHGRTGLVVPKGNAAELASAACSLLDDTASSGELRASLIRQARQASIRFSGETYVDSLIRLYANAVSAFGRDRYRP